MNQVVLADARGRPLDDVAVECWSIFPASVLPVDVPVGALSTVPGRLAMRLKRGYVGTRRTDGKGRLALPRTFDRQLTVRAFATGDVDTGAVYLGHARVTPADGAADGGDGGFNAGDGDAGADRTVRLSEGNGSPVPKLAGGVVAVVLAGAAAWWAVGGGGGGGSSGSDSGDDDGDGGDGGGSPADPDAPRWSAPPGLAGDVAFLYEGEDARQTGLDVDSLDDRRVAVLRGGVTDNDGTPLPAVTVSLQDRPEFGETTTDDAGVFDLVVNGGGRETVVYAAEGWLTAYRELTVPWQDYRWLPDVALVADDAPTTTVSFGEDEPTVVEGANVEDGDGERRGVLFVPPGTVAKQVVDGEVVATTELDVRVTEVTVGPYGPAAMTATLPAGTGYTYAMNFGGFDLADDSEEATDRPVLDAGEGDIQFDTPLVYYVQNFLGFPVGGVAPVGAYDSTATAWGPSDNGRVVAVVGVDGGLADLDVDGSETAADAATLDSLGVTDAERRMVAEYFEQGDSLWRVPVPHFCLWDVNWPIMLPFSAIAPVLDRVADTVADIVDCVTGGGN